MEKIALACLLALFETNGFSQGYDNTQSAKVSGSSFRNPYRGKAKPLGSPYFQIPFAKAKVVNINVEAFMRYNIQSDEFEFITPKNDTLILDKVDDFSHIVFNGLNRKYDLIAYVEGKKLNYGYLLKLYEKNNFTLFKKENVQFTEAKVAKTSLETSMPAKYNKTSDSFFLKNKEAGVVEFPDSKKALLKLFPDKKAAIEDFLKTNKTDFDAESDLIQVVNLLAQ